MTGRKEGRKEHTRTRERVDTRLPVSNTGRDPKVRPRSAPRGPTGRETRGRSRGRPPGSTRGEAVGARLLGLGRAFLCLSVCLSVSSRLRLRRLRRLLRRRRPRALRVVREALAEHLWCHGTRVITPPYKASWCHGTRYVRHARGWYAYSVRTVRGGAGQAALRLWCVRHAGGWLVRVARSPWPVARSP